MHCPRNDTNYDVVVFIARAKQTSLKKCYTVEVVTDSETRWHAGYNFKSMVSENTLQGVLAELEENV